MSRATASPFSLPQAHATGRKLLKEQPGRGRYGDNELHKLAKGFGLTKHQAWVFRRFAHTDRGYTLQELKQLLGLCREHDYELTTSFIELLIRVPRQQRRRFERRLIRKQWNFQQAKRQVQSLVGKRQGGGRRHQLPADRAGRLRRLEESCASWQRLAEDLLAARNGEAMPPAIKQHLRQATAVVTRVREAALNAHRGQAGT